MHKNLIFTLSISIMFLTTSCFSLKEVQLKKIENVSIKNMDLNNMEIEVLARINNPNKMSFKLKQVDLDVFSGKGKLGKAKLLKKVNIKGNCEETYALLVKVKPDGNGLITGAGAALGMLKNGGSNFTFKGTIKGGKWLINKSFEVNTNERIGR